MTRKLIEVALPLEAISVASRREKDRSVGTIKNVHKWFAPMPTPAWRALLFAAVVDDPGDGPARDQLLEIAASLVPSDGSPPSEETLNRAKRMMNLSGPAPTVLDPFCGGGSTIVEALRLGLPAVGSDLNPVPVLISKVLCELMPAVVGRPPLSTGTRLPGTDGPFSGFLTDVHHYASRVRDVAWERVGQMFPEVPGGGTTVAWLWARTITCSNPACGAKIPAYSSSWLSKRKGNERWLNPVLNGKSVTFEIREGAGPPPDGTKLGRGSRFRCLICGETASERDVKNEGSSSGLGTQLLCTVVDLPGGGRTYLQATSEQEAAARVERPEDVSDDVLQPEYTRWFSSPAFGMKSYADLFSNRQLHVLSAFADSIAEAAGWVVEDGGDELYSQAVSSVLALALGKLAQTNSTQVRWYLRDGPSRCMPTFGTHALPMVWDFAEAYAFGESVGAWSSVVDSIAGGLSSLPIGPIPARVVHLDARSAASLVEPGSALIATDPPYFAHIGYADLSDYFYMWHRRALRGVFPEMYGTLATPKSAELIAAPYRHGGDSQASYEAYVSGYRAVFAGLHAAGRIDLPMIVVYAHRQEERSDDGITSSGWDAMLEALLAAGLAVVGTWPIEATRSTRQVGLGTNSLASYIVLVCRTRDAQAGITDRQGFVRALRAELPTAIRALQHADTLPFDLTQAVIGPGMAVFSRFSRVVEPDGEPMRVRSALSLINQVRSTVLSEQDDEFDAETRWAIQWFERYEFARGPFGEAEKLFVATATSLEGLRRTGIVASKAPDVWLVDPSAMPSDWDPVTDLKTCTWEVTMHLLRALHHSGGESEAARLLAKVDHLGDLARDLAYRLADICEATMRANTALAVNGLIAAWPEISRLAATTPPPSQESLL